MQVAAGNFGKTGIQFFAYKLNFIFLKMRLATCSEVFVDVARVVDDSCQLCEVLCQFAEDCNMCIKNVGNAGGENGKCAGENKTASDLLYSLC